MSRRTIHLVQRGVQSSKCLACGETSPIISDDRPIDHRGIPAVCLNRSDWDTIYYDHAEYRRCVDAPDSRDAPNRPYPVPTEPGWYWAEWRIAEDGTFENERDDTTPQTWSEVVEVFDRGSIDEPELRAAVAGVEKSQGLDCFVWRSDRLEPPR